MAGWSAVAGTHSFLVPGEYDARALAQALADYGFALVTAGPARSSDGWTVTAFDEGPYSLDRAGHRTINAVAEQAAVIAREHGGEPSSGARCDPRMLDRLRPADPAVECTNPGARPPVPVVVIAPAPPDAPLALTPDRAEDLPIDLTGLDDVPWAGLSHAHGSAEDIPELIRALADPYGDWAETLDELFGDNLLHQGSTYSATAPALPFLTRMIVSGALPARERLDLYVWLLIAAKESAGQRSETVHDAVAAQVAALVERWSEEPPAIRYVLACLAGLYPREGHRLGERIAAMAGQLEGTRPGELLRLAHALAASQEDRARALAAGIAGWADLDDPDDPDASGVLADGALRALRVAED